MRAVGYHEAGPLGRPDAFVDLELPDPEPGPRDLLVRVAAVSVNPIDTKVRRTRQPAAGAAQVLGWDAVGVVEGLGADVRGFAEGDRVFYAGSLNRPGTNSELHVVDHRLAAHAPRSLDDAAAAAVPLTAITAWEILFDRLGVPRLADADGRTLLVVGGAGGVGSMLIQLARQLTGLTVRGHREPARDPAVVPRPRRPRGDRPPRAVGGSAGGVGAPVRRTRGRPDPHR